MKRIRIILIFVIALVITSLALASAEGPINNITDTTPKYVWSKVTGATNYQIQLWRGTTFIYTNFLSSDACGSTTCSRTPTTILGYYDYQWRVRARVGDVWGLWSSYKTFTVIPAPTPQTPSGDITDSTPKYTWTKVTGATNYQIQLWEGTTFIYTYFLNSDACGSTTCSRTPTTILANSVYKWRVRAKLDGVWGAWSSSSYKTFTVKPVPTPQTPSDDITDSTPKYTWSKVTGATNYQFQLWKGTTFIYRYFLSSDACGSTTCSRTPTTNLGYYDYQWRVRAKLDGVWEPWSAYKTFTVSSVPIPKKPSRDIMDRTPKYVWTKVSGAANYQFQLRKGTTFIYAKYASSDACGSSTCSKTPTTTLGYYDYKWRVRAKLDGVWGAWSHYKIFTVKPLPAPAGNWISTIACQNLDLANAAEITLTFYAASNGSAVSSYDDTIPAGGSKNYVTSDPELNLPTGFLGSAVVSSSHIVACNANTKTGDGSNKNPYRLSSSSGLSDTITTSKVDAPQVMKTYNGWNSYIVVQNTGNSVAKVKVSYRRQNGNLILAANETVNIAAHSSKVIYQEANVELPDKFIGSAKVTSINPTDARIAVLVNFYNLGDSPGTSQFHSYNGFSAGAKRLYVPRVVRQFYGYNSGMTIQNIGTIDSAVTITFNFDGNTYVYHTETIRAKAATPIYLPNIPELAPVASLAISHRFGSAVLEADEPGALIVAIVNEDNRGNPKDNDGNPVPIERIGQGSSYNAIAAGTESKTLYFQQVMSKVDGNISGGFQISNITNQAGTCDITFYGAPEANISGHAIEAHGSLSMYAPDIPDLPDGFNAGVTATCTVNVIGIANASAEPGSNKVGDSFLQNNAINK